MIRKNNGHNQSSVRISNRFLVLELLRNSEELTVAQISRQVKLSKTTIWKIIDHFLQQNLILLCGKADASEEGGKKPELYRFNENCGYIISIALLGEVVHLALTDARSNVFYKEVIHIRSNEVLEALIRIMADFIRKWQDPKAPARKESHLLGIVVACSGVVDSENGMSITASLFNSWQPLSPIRNLIAEQVELKAPFYIDNYNRFHAYAEKTIGQVRDRRNIICIVINRDGIGAGIIADEKLKRGPRFLTGEIGHMRLDPSGKELCRCGGKGCFEQLTSIVKLLEQAEKECGSYPESILQDREITLQSIFDAADGGDVFARFLLDPVIGWFAIALYNTNLVFNAETILIAGDYRNAGNYFLTSLKKRVEEIGFLRMNKQFDIRYSIFDEEGALRGGASYVANDYFEARGDY